MFISTAYAQTAGAAPGGADLFIQFAPLVLIFVVFYFMLIRPQQKKMKEHKAMLEGIRRGDKIVTGGGILGSVVRVGSDDELVVEIAENVRIRCLRSTVSLVVTKSEPAKDGAAKDGDKAEAADSKEASK